MRVATYTDASAPAGKSGFALVVLVVTLLLGTGVLPTMAEEIGGLFAKVITPSWLLLYLGCAAGLMFSYGINWISWLIRYRLLLVILLLGAIVSVSWSVDPQVSTERVVHLLGSSLIAIYIGFSIPLLITLRVFAVVLGVMMIASVGTALFVPTIGIENYEGTVVWRGVFNSKNDFGFWAAVSVLLYITLSESSLGFAKKILCFTLAGVSLLALLMSQSATSLLAMLVAGSLALYLYIAGRFQLGFIRMMFIAILFIALTSLAISNVETTELVGRSGDLTGRGEVWRQVINLILEHPLTGVGYGVLWFPTDETIWVQQSFFDFTWVVHHAHNGILQVASEVGMPLAVIALLMVAQQSVEIFYCQYERRQVGVLFVLAFVTAFLISNFSEARFLVTRELFWIFFLALPISMLRQVNLSAADMYDAEGSDLPEGAFVQAVGAASEKPWLDPNAGKIHQSGTFARLPHRPADAEQVATQADSKLSQSHDNAENSVLDVDTYDISFSILSVDDADIDLGDVSSGNEKLLTHSDPDDTEKSSQEPIDASESKASSEDQTVEREKSDEQQKSSKVTMLHDHTLGHDRFDFNFDNDNEWIDIGPDVENTR